MAYGYQVLDRKKIFRSWLHYQKELVEIARAEGFTTDQAIELLKVYELRGIQDNTGMIGSSY